VLKTATTAYSPCHQQKLRSGVTRFLRPRTHRQTHTFIQTPMHVCMYTLFPIFVEVVLIFLEGMGETRPSFFLLFLFMMLGRTVVTCEEVAIGRRRQRALRGCKSCMRQCVSQAASHFKPLNWTSEPLSEGLIPNFTELATGKVEQKGCGPLKQLKTFATTLA